MKKLAVIFLLITGVALTGCSNSEPEGTPTNPVSSSGEEFHVEVEPGNIATCLRQGAGNNRVLACVPADEGVSPVVSAEDADYQVVYYEFGNGVPVPCLEDGRSGGRVLSCVEFN